MATVELEASNQPIPNEAKLDIPQNEAEQEKDQEVKINYSQRAQWLRAAVLGASDGLVSTASLMMGVGAVKQDVKSMIITGFAGMVAGACSMAIGEFVSVYSQYDIELSEMKRQHKASDDDGKESLDESEKEDLPNPFTAAGASALAFVVGAGVPLLSASFIQNYMVRLGVVIAMSSLALIVFGILGGVLGRASVKKSCLRVLIGGWLAMAITYGLTKLIGLAGV
ncbi:vacuolar iron transporter homolog 4-like [Macadamia integrifolia]|uniref:vacuolar iron transporter homolog 4-like n=1 Tax=Macadamia integrifolia TaxID=60698 RepID=UPI001C4F3349|nr:vacuolar iron transporter homolog 4-like [Macadamia integrifolia]